MSLREYVRQADIAAYPFRTIVQARYNDVDGLGHINNVAIIELFSEARSHMLRELMPIASRRNGFRFVVGQQGAIYVGETMLEQPIEIACGILEIGRSSFRVAQVLFNGGKPTAGAEAVLVCGAGGRSQPIGPEGTAALSRFALSRDAVPRLLA